LGGWSNGHGFLRAIVDERNSIFKTDFYFKFENFLFPADLPQVFPSMNTSF
jgi:hypothetical protein